MDVDSVIKSVLDFNDIEAEIITKKFRYYKDIHKLLKGIYILMQGDEVVYVGKGNIADRQRKHWKKANGDLKIKDPEGWHWLNKHVEITPKDWTIKYLILHKQTELLILILECFLDNYVIKVL
jgi:hypothetical protein